MKTETAVAQTWDDLVFENRNKEYGAYPVRRSYSDRIIYALFISLSAMTLALITPVLLAMLRGEEVKIIPPKDIFEGMIKPKIYEVTPQKPARRVLPTPAQSLPTRPVVPVVTTDEVPNVINPQEPLDVNFTEPGEFTGSTPGDLSTLGGSGESTVVEKGPEWILHPQVMPSFVGGEKEMVKFLQRAVHYPLSARRTGVDGKVFISFVIGADGTIMQAEVIKGIDPDCDKEALRVVNLMPRWKPGRQNDSPVAVRMVLPIRFLVEH